MSRKCFKLNKCERMDMVSELPDEIIGHILSYLPLEDAVATSVLSLRWLNLWKYTPNLVFINTSFNEPMMNIPIAAMPIEEPIDWTYVHSLKNTEWVQSVLNSYKALPIKHSYKALSIKQFTVSLYMHPKTYHHVNKWLYFAFSRQVENLKLDFQFSSFLLDTKTFSGIQISDFKFLKELTLEKFKVSGEAIEFLLRNCSSLEGLVMRAILMSDLVICATLKYLEIHACRKPGKFIKVSAPNLTRLSCNYDHAMVFLENVPNLVDASFIFVLPEQTMHDFANEAAKLETLNITLMRPRAFSVPQMSKLKKLVLDYAAVYTEYLLPVTCLLEACPYLEEFKFEISDLAMYFMLNSICEAVLEVPKHGEFRHNCLKVFEFGGFYEKAGDHVELVMYIVNKCVALEKIIISPICHAIAREFHGRTGMLDWPLELTQVDAIAEERYALPKKKSTEQLLSAKIPPHIKLIIK